MIKIVILWSFNALQWVYHYQYEVCDEVKWGWTFISVVNWYIMICYMHQPLPVWGLLLFQFKMVKKKVKEIWVPRYVPPKPTLESERPKSQKHKKKHPLNPLAREGNGMSSWYITICYMHQPGTASCVVPSSFCYQPLPQLINSLFSPLFYNPTHCSLHRQCVHTQAVNSFFTILVDTSQT